MTNLKSISRLAVLASTMGAFLGSPCAAAPPPARFTPQAWAAERPGSSDAFADSIGADSHFYMTSEPYVTKFSIIGPEVVASGFRHLRDSNSGTAYAAKMEYLADHGVKHSIGFTVGETAAQMSAALATWAPEADFAESANEWDTSRGTNPNWASQLRSLQALIYHTVRSNRAYASLPILGPSIASPNEYAPVGNLELLEDAGNLHNSSCDYNPGVLNDVGVAAWLARARIITPTKPIWITETGYNSDVEPYCSLPNDIIAKYDLRTVADYWNAGVPRVYFYQLVDMPSDPIFGGMGLIAANGVPKPQFIALSSIIKLLADPGPAFRPSPLRYLISGDMANVAHTLLQRRDGTYELLLWLEKPAWDHNRRVRITVPSQTVELTLPVNPVSSGQFSYNSRWGLSASPLHFTQASANVTVTDSISIVTFKL